MKKKSLIISIISIVIIVLFIVYYMNNSIRIENIDDIKKYDSSIEQIVEKKSFGDLDIFLCTDQKNNYHVISFENNYRNFSKSSIGDGLFTFNGSYQTGSIIIVFGKNNGDINSLSYTVGNKMLTVNELEDNYIFEVYITLDNESIGEGNAYNKKDELLFKF